MSIFGSAFMGVTPVLGKWQSDSVPFLRRRVGRLSADAVVQCYVDSGLACDAPTVAIPAPSGWMVIGDRCGALQGDRSKTALDGFRRGGTCLTARPVSGGLTRDRDDDRRPLSPGRCGPQPRCGRDAAPVARTPIVGITLVLYGLGNGIYSILTARSRSRCSANMDTRR
jgi:hypothetical protein